MTVRLSATGNATLIVRTGVTGRASAMGHRLTIVFRDWTADVDQDDDAVTAVSVRVAVESMDVVGGEGGVTPMFGPEKALARSNALRTLDADRYPDIRFDTTSVDTTGTGLRLSGALQIHGTTRDHTVDVTIDGGHVELESSITQTDFGIKPYSQLLGAMKVVDDVTVTFTASVPS